MLFTLATLDKMYFKHGMLPSIAAKCIGVLPSLSHSSNLPPAVLRNCKQPNLFKLNDSNKSKKDFYSKEKGLSFTP
jgi:hypothetical protein